MTSTREGKEAADDDGGGDGDGMAKESTRTMMEI